MPLLYKAVIITASSYKEGNCAANVIKVNIICRELMWNSTEIDGKQEELRFWV
jgi:hypothetical protein